MSHLSRTLTLVTCLCSQGPSVHRQGTGGSQEPEGNAASPSQGKGKRTVVKDVMGDSASMLLQRIPHFSFSIAQGGRGLSTTV